MMQQSFLNAFSSPDSPSALRAAERVGECAGESDVDVTVVPETVAASEAYDWAALERTVKAPAVHRFQRDVLVGDTYLGRDLLAGAQAWGDVTTLAFVRAEPLGAAGTLVSVARFDARGTGRVCSVVMTEAFALERARKLLAGARQIVLVGHAVEEVAPLLDFDARIVARRSALSLRAHEVGVLRALRDEAWHLGGRLRQDVDPTDTLTMEWLVQRAEGEVLSLVVSSLPQGTSRAGVATLH